MKHCGVVTPFRGVRVYASSAMGMPGSETALEELLCRVLGDLLEEGVVAKLADDIYCGATQLLSFKETSDDYCSALPTVFCDDQPQKQLYVQRKL